MWWLGRLRWRGVAQFFAWGFDDLRGRRAGFRRCVITQPERGDLFSRQPKLAQREWRHRRLLIDRRARFQRRVFWSGERFLLRVFGVHIDDLVAVADLDFRFVKQPPNLL